MIIQINYRTFILDIWTNGSISPEDAISIIIEFIIELFNSIMENKFTQDLDVI